MTAPICPVDGYPYTQHPPAVPPTRRYLRARQALIHAVIPATAEVIYWPGISDAHRAAILRARTERRAA